MRAVALAMVAAVVAGGVLLLRAETMSNHVATPPGSYTEVVVHAETKGNHRSARRGEITQALVLTCRLQVNAELRSTTLEPIDGGVYALALEPALDESDRKQLHGCLEDARIDHLQVRVVRLENILVPPPVDGPGAAGAVS